jgi:hypothetical protein
MTIRTRIVTLLAVLALAASVAHADPSGGTGGGTISNGTGGKPGLTSGMTSSDPGGGTGGGTVTPKP